ncbi:neuropeptide CCHamide-1 receptor-like [Periplaneta americana]|uniref:neuropeptide CCHamide-1 receptor-like n=1 Tax=Periplaneta americana TaxID=6978 RepID=UPI0037E73A64
MDLLVLTVILNFPREIYAQSSTTINISRTEINRNFFKDNMFVTSSTRNKFTDEITSFNESLIPTPTINGIDGNWTSTKHDRTILNENMDEGFRNFLVLKKYLDPTIMCIIFIVGTMSNVTLLLILARHKEMRTSINACILTMALGDLLSVIVNIPLFYALLVSNRWTVGVVLCKAMWFFSDFAVGLSIFAVAMLSVQRYRGIVATSIHIHNGLQNSRSRLISGLNITLIWVLSLAFALRTAVTANVKDEECRSVAGTYGTEFSKNVALLNLFIFCIIPLIVIAIFYSLTARHLVESVRDVPGELSTNLKKIIRGRKKGARIVSALTAVFFVSYVPWYSWQVIFFWGNFVSDYKTATYTYTFLYYFFFGNLCFNPVALYCVSTTFRNYFNFYLFCRRKTKFSRMNEITTSSAKSKISSLHSRTNTTV